MALFTSGGKMERKRRNIHSRDMPNFNRNDTDKIIVEDGHIYIKIMPNTASTTRNGIVYLTTIMPGSLYTGESTVKRIKIDITQKGN